jgi:hypothetical protein
MMMNSHSPESLTSALSVLLGERNSSALPLRIVGRAGNPLAASFPSEVVKCELADGNLVCLLCKYEYPHAYPPALYRKRINEECGLPNQYATIRYEAEVYSAVYPFLEGTPPKLYGVHRSENREREFLAIEYVQCAVTADRLDAIESQAAMLEEAARWLGRFHSRPVHKALADGPVAVVHFGTRYYHHWAARTVMAARELGLHTQPIDRAIELFAAGKSFLMKRPVLIHGDFYADNVLSIAGAIYPIDWACAAVASGELDLAMLTHLIHHAILKVA